MILDKILNSIIEGTFFKKAIRRINSELNEKLTLRYEKYRLLYKLHRGNYDVVVLNSPIYGNYGDHAIFVSQKQFLKRIYPGCHILEVPGEFIDNSDRVSLFASIRKNHPHIFYMGGGNLGTLWPVFEERFERMLEALPDETVTVFPQTVYFDPSEKECLDNAHKIYGSHSKLLLCVRERRSLDFMCNQMPDVRTMLLPDMVLLLKNKDFRRKCISRRGILWCFRGDTEKSVRDGKKNKYLRMIEDAYPDQKIMDTGTTVDRLISSIVRDRMLNNKLAEFASARLVVTDRLHGMIFAVITGTPCIAFDNISKKVSGVYEWVQDLPYVQFVQDEDQFNHALKEMDTTRKYEYDNTFAERRFEALRRYLLDMGL